MFNGLYLKLKTEGKKNGNFLQEFNIDFIMSHWFDPQTSIAIDIIKKSKNIVAFTGAGISTESGIADFRSPGGLWSQFNPDKYADYNGFLKNPEFYWELDIVIWKFM